MTLLSVTEGDDKPAKYPVMFRAADVMLLTKSDLLDVLDDFDTAKAERHLRELANPAEVMTLSAAGRRPWKPGWTGCASPLRPAARVGNEPEHAAGRRAPAHPA